MINYLYVGLGGVLGALARFLVTLAMQNAAVTAFPCGTLAVNLLGSFLLGFIVHSSMLRWRLPQPCLLVINTGCIGSFTTFSTFSAETVVLLEKAVYLPAAAYIVISVGCGLALAWLGIALAQHWHQNKAHGTGGVG